MEFPEKYISKRYLDMKKKEFLGLKESNRSVVQDKSEQREIVSSKEEMCICFEDILNDDIKLLVGAMEIREFVVLFERD